MKRAKKIYMQNTNMKIITTTGNYESKWIKDGAGNIYPVLPTNMFSKIYFGVMHCSNGHEADEDATYYQSPNAYFDLCLATYDEEGDITKESALARVAFLKQYKDWYTLRTTILSKPHMYA